MMIIAEKFDAKTPKRVVQNILRKQQDEVLKTPPPPKGKWVFIPDPVQPEWHPPVATDSKPEEKAPDKKPEPAPAGKE